MEIRDATVGDADLLWRMLTYAASMPAGAQSVTEARSDPKLAFYVEGFLTKPGDLGVVAVLHGAPCGAAWVRLLDGPPQPSKVATRTEPELAIGVDPDARGNGIGLGLLRALALRARTQYPAIVLSVREENPSRRLYERAGFVVVEQMINRVGGRSLAMRLALS